ncbi:hypothetical protein ABW19_dt0201503 [Dactylella cylindrospora]|nr:hypothetical protein ABW19_dt0201503 [Dactylella cylindrospora]
MDTYYYDLLGVAVDASDLEIKKGYRKAAFLNHPDKNPGDPNAHRRFQEIAEAYRILSDTQLRAHYDRVGRKGVEENSETADANEMFAKMFSGESFMDWVGDNTLFQDIFTLMELHRGDSEDRAASFNMVFSVDPNASYGRFDHQEYLQEQKYQRGEMQKAKITKFAEERKEKREKRIKLVAERLAARLDEFPWEERHRGKFRDAMEQEAENLKLESFGVHILNTIGQVYLSRADHFQWSNRTAGLSYIFHYAQDKLTSAKDTAKTIWDLLEAQKAVHEARLDEMDETQAEAIKRERGAEEQDLLEKIATGKMLMSCWGLVRKDLIDVLR